MSRKQCLMLAFILCCSIAKTFGDCVVKFPSDVFKIPTVTKRVGSRGVINLDKPNSNIRLKDGEEIFAECDTMFISPQTNGYLTLNIYCDNGVIRDYYSNELFVECESQTWDLYEASESFSWCPAPLASYVLAHPAGAKGFQIAAGICYSFEKLTVQSVHYVRAPTSLGHLPQSMFREYIPRTKVENVHLNFESESISSNTYQNQQVEDWMEFANYENNALIQNDAVHQYAVFNLGGLIDVTWWSGLRLGNWKLYEEALRQHIEADAMEYNVLSGISSTVSAPIIQKSCDSNRTFVEIVDYMNRKIPLYIWQYMKSSRHNSEDFVVIGVNSPFYEFYNEKDLVFCRNICSHIEWLQKIYRTFHYKTMGVIFCCAVDDVKASGRLNGFPMSPQAENPSTLTYYTDQESGSSDVSQEFNIISNEFDTTFTI